MIQINPVIQSHQANPALLNYKIGDQTFLLRPAVDDDIPSLRRLVNVAYKELADRGWNYTATYQDEETTRARIKNGIALVLELNGEIVAAILYRLKNCFTGKNTAYWGQLAVLPQLKKIGLGTILMDYCEQKARAEKLDGVQLDTAQPAEHLVEWYLKRGYEIVGETHYEGKTYDSYVFEKCFLTQKV